MTLPSGRVVDYTRDGVRRVDGIDTTINGTAQSIVSNIQYRGDNQMTQCTYGNGLIDERNYDLQGRLVDQQLRTSGNTLIDQRLYSYDKNSNITNIDTNLEDNAYAYDKLDRLINDAIDNGAANQSNHDLTYDLNDNRLSRVLDDITLEEALEYQASSNRVIEWDTFKEGQDFLTALPNRNMEYNDAGRLFQLLEEGTLKAEYIYNDQGQRTRKVNYQADGITVDSITIYHYDQMGYLVTETDEQGNLIKDYIWQEGMTPVAQIDNTFGTEQVIYLHTDHLMTNRLATDDFQSVVWRWEGEAFGNTQAQELAGISVNLRFPGQYYDAETGLHYNHHRYYDPSIGRYITSDPIGLLGGINTYSYADQSPNNSYDFNGLRPIPGSGNKKKPNSFGAGSIDGAGGAILGYSISFGTVNSCGRTCSFIRECKSILLGAFISGGGSAGGGSEPGCTCTGMATENCIFGTGAIGLFGKLEACVSGSGGVSGAISGGKGLGAAIGIQTCIVTYKCRGEDPCECRS